MNDKLYSMDIERAVLATLLSHGAYEQCEGLINANSFHAGRHQKIFEIIAELASNGNPYGLIEVSDEIKRKDLEKLTGGDEYLADMAMNAPVTTFNIEYHVSKLLDLAQRREMTSQYDTAKESLTDTSKRLEDVWSDTSEQVNKILQTSANESYESVSELLKDFVENLHKNATSGQLPSRKTGITALDNKCMFMDGELIVIGARPSMGKTTLAQNILANMAKNEDGTAVFFSLEMPKIQVMNRLVSSEGNVPMNKIFSGQCLSEDDWGNIFIATERLDKLPMVIDDRAGLTLGQVRATLNKIRQTKGNISAVMVDYLQLMTVAGNQTENEKVQTISKGLKQIAKEFDCPVIALSQLNRSLENRPDKRPTMSDLRSSGAIEQDADHIIFIYRDEVYNKPKNDDNKSNGNKPKNAGIAELIVGKQRNGTIGTVLTRFDGMYSRFTDFMGVLDDEFIS